MRGGLLRLRLSLPWKSCIGERQNSREPHDKNPSRNRKVALSTESSCSFEIGVRLQAGVVRRYSTFIPTPERPGVQRDEPWAYFLTFACYGNRLHGHEAGSVDRHHNACGARLLEAGPLREAYERRRMVEGVATLDSPARKVVLEAIQEVCRHEGWDLYALHVRQTHVHLVLWPASKRPEYVLGKLKSYASRKLNQRFGHHSKQWARHGSTRWLWSPLEVDAAIDYVLRRQGRPMELYEKIDRWPGLRYRDGVT